MDSHDYGVGSASSRCQYLFIGTAYNICLLEKAQLIIQEILVRQTKFS